MRLMFAMIASLVLSAGGVKAADFSAMKSAPLVERVRMECDPSRCLDTRTGAYTQSGCNSQGCYPISGVMGYVDDEDEDRGRRRHRGPPSYGRPQGPSGSQWDCNRSRCIENSTGRIWESTCNRSGCFPLRPTNRRY